MKTYPMTRKKLDNQTHNDLQMFRVIAICSFQVIVGKEVTKENIFYLKH